MRLARLCLIAAASLVGAYGAAQAAPVSGLAASGVAPQATEAPVVQKVHGRYYRRHWRPRVYSYYYRPYYSYYRPYYYRPYYSYYRPYPWGYRRSGVWLSFRF